MTTDIFIVSYAPDAVWLEYCLRSIAKYALGFRQTIVAYPFEDSDVLRPLCDRFGVAQKCFPQGADGHLDQNIAKTQADLYSDADYILHVDSDWMFTEPAGPEDYIYDGKPILWFEHYSNLQGSHGGHPVPWREITAFALGVTVEVETMRRFPILYPRSIYQKTRDRIASVHDKSFEDYVRTAPKLGTAFHGYSEFNAIGCAAFYLHPEEFSVRHISWGADRPSRMKQFWSHHLRCDRPYFEAQIRPELERIVA